MRILYSPLYSFWSSLLACMGPKQQTLRIILPVGAGSGVDTIARAFVPSLIKAVGQPVVIDNLHGADGITGTSVLAPARLNQTHPRSRCSCVQHAESQGSHDQTRQRDQPQHARGSSQVFAQRDDALCRAGEEGGHRSGLVAGLR
jgi:hypothetical protein